jgi:hypothetical protein
MFLLRTFKHSGIYIIDYLKLETFPTRITTRALKKLSTKYMNLDAGHYPGVVIIYIRFNWRPSKVNHQLSGDLHMKPKYYMHQLR